MASKKNDVQLLEQLWRVADATERHVEAVLQDLTELSVPQFFVLRALAALPADQGALAPTDIARTLGCSKANAGQLVTRLEERRMLRKHSGSGDARVIALRLTASGEECYERADEQIVTEAKRWLSPLDADEKQQLLALLKKLTSPS